MVLKPPARSEWGAHGATPTHRLTLLVAPEAGAVAVGSLAFTRAQADSMTFVVKRSFTFDGAGRLAACPARLTIDRRSRNAVDHPDALDAGSDFAPWKSQADVVIVGHATLAAPATSSSIVVEIAGRRAERTARSTAETTALPLALPYLGGERLGPARGFAPYAGLYYADAPDDAFQTAAPDLRFALGALEAAPTLSLLGLLAGYVGRPLVLALPAQRPLVRIINHASEERALDLALDTVRVDLDEQRVDLTYRATVAGRPAHTIVVDGFREPGADPGSSIGAPRMAHSMSAAANEDDARLEREPELDAVARQIAIGEALTGPCPEPTMQLERYAEIHADLAERPTQRTEVLRAHGLDDVSWTTEERAWLERMAEDAMRGDPGSATSFGALFVEAQDQLVSPRETEMELAEFARISVVFERAEEPMEALEAEQLTFAQWMRLGRIWSRRTDDDPRLERVLEAALDRERARAGSEA